MNDLISDYFKKLDNEDEDIIYELSKLLLSPATLRVEHNKSDWIEDINQFLDAKSKKVQELQNLWVSHNEIKQYYLKKYKTITKSLDTPLGFITQIADTMARLNNKISFFELVDEVEIDEIHNEPYMISTPKLVESCKTSYQEALFVFDRRPNIDLPDEIINTNPINREHHIYKELNSRMPKLSIDQIGKWSVIEAVKLGKAESVPQLIKKIEDISMNTSLIEIWNKWRIQIFNPKLNKSKTEADVLDILLSQEEMFVSDIAKELVIKM
jgi:hypothetical protein